MFHLHHAVGGWIRGSLPGWNLSHRGTQRSRDLAGIPNFSETYFWEASGWTKVSLTLPGLWTPCVARGSDGEAQADLGQTLVGVGHVFPLGGQRRTGPVMAVVPHHRLPSPPVQPVPTPESYSSPSHAGPGTRSRCRCSLQRLFGQVQHWGGRNSGGLGEVLLTGFQQTVDPWQQLLGGVVGVRITRERRGLRPRRARACTGDGFR